MKAPIRSCRVAIGLEYPYRYNSIRAHTWRGNGIATSLYKANKCAINQRGTLWHLRQITDEIEPSERGRHVLGAEKKRKRDEKTALRKAQRAEVEPLTDETNPRPDEKQS